MTRRSRLDDADARETVIKRVCAGDSLACAARALGITQPTLSRYLGKHPGFAEEVAAARSRAETIAHHAPRMLPDRPADGAPVTEVDREELLLLLLGHARDTQSRGCAKALGILSDLAFAPELLRIRAEAKRAERDAEGGDQRPVVVRVPALAPATRTIDVEILDDQTDDQRG